MWCASTGVPLRLSLKRKSSPNGPLPVTATDLATSSGNACRSRLGLLMKSNRRIEVHLETCEEYHVGKRWDELRSPGQAEACPTKTHVR